MRTIQQYWLSILELFWNYFGTSRNDGLVRTARIMGYTYSLIQHSQRYTKHYTPFDPIFFAVLLRSAAFYINNLQKGFGTPNMFQKGAAC